MTHFRFRYKRMGYMRWRWRTASRQAKLLVLPKSTDISCAPGAAAWRRMMAKAVVLNPVLTTLRVGQFLVSEEWDPQLAGHPDIRY
ncbi:hypothetical protein [Hymenobacter glacialis]|nr:hypothetical protein [Hymenobacter glacialis]